MHIFKGKNVQNRDDTYFKRKIYNIATNAQSSISNVKTLDVKLPKKPKKIDIVCLKSFVLFSMLLH